MVQIQFSHGYDDIISLENILEAWNEFIRGKRARKDVQEFQRNLMSNIISLHNNLVSRTYKHSLYEAFNICDPKPRSIHKASVRDRLLHHMLYRKLYPFFDKTFIAHSYSCRFGKGTHKAINTFRKFYLKVSKNNSKTVWVLKCDAKKFFASIDQVTLIRMITDCIPDKDLVWLIQSTIQSFHSTQVGVGLPLGNLTSQLLVNVYMNKFDQFIKHSLKAKYYIRYADDFVIFSEDKKHLENLLPRIKDFLWGELKLRLHPDKISIETIASGVDFLGWVHFPDHRVVRAVTRKRMFRNIRVKEGKRETVQSYLGLLEHGNTHKIRKEILKH